MLLGVYVLWFATILILIPVIIEFDFYKLIINIFSQLCSQVRANPSGALSSLVFMCNAIASWNVSMSLSIFGRL